MRKSVILKNPLESVEFFLLTQKFTKVIQDAHIIDFYARKERFEQAGREDTQGLIQKDLLLEIPRDFQKELDQVFEKDATHTSKLAEGF